jgi:hypothetical protein
MSDIVTMEKINKLMTYLGMDSYIIPHYQLSMPDVVNGANFRPEKIFRLHRDGTMSYKGYGYGKIARDVELFGIKPDQRYLTRAYIEMIGEVRKKVKYYARRGGIPNLEYLILKFNGIDFIGDTT